MNLKTACQKCLHYGLVWGATIAFVLLLLISGILIRLYYKPYDLKEYMPAIHQVLYFENMGGVEFDNLTLSFDGRLNLEGEGVLVLGPERKMLATGRKLRLELSPFSFLEGVVAFKVLEFDGLGARFVVADGGVKIGQYTLPEKQNFDKTQALQVFDKLKERRALKYLEVVNFKNTMAHITVDSSEGAHSWDIRNTDMLFTQNKKLGAHAELTGVLKRGEDATSFFGAFEKPRDTKNARLKTRIGSLESSLFAPLLPPEWRQKLQATFQGVNMELKLDENMSLEEASVAARLGTTTINMPNVYPDGIHLRSANLGFTYFPNYKESADKEGDKTVQRFQIDDLVLEDTQGLIASGKGSVNLPSDSEKILADTIFRVDEARISDVITYLPPEHTKDLIKWFHESTNYETALLEGITLNIAGDLRKFPFDYGEANNKIGLMEAHFDYKDLHMVLHPKLPKLENLSGQAVLQGDVIRIVSPQGGELADQRMADIDVIISDIIVSDNPPLLRGTGSVKGPASGMLPLVAKLFDTQPLLDEMQGTQNSRVDLVFPLTGDEGDLQFSVKTEVTDTAFKLPHINKPFQASKLTVETTDQQLTVKSNGYVRLLPEAEKPWPAELLWRENMGRLGQETFVEATLTTIDNPAPAVLDNLKTQVKGEMTHNFTLERSQADPKWFNVAITTDMTSAQVNVDSFDWQKRAGDKGTFQLEGRMSDTGRVFDAEMLLLKAPEAEVLGAVYMSLDENMNTRDFTLNLSPFRLGGTNSSVIYQDKNFSLTGESFNFTGIGAGTLHEDMKLADGRYDIDLNKLTFKGGEFYNMKGFFLRENGVWDKAHLNAKVGEDKSDFTMHLADSDGEEEKPVKHLEIFSDDAGSALRALGVYDNLHKGKMEAFLRIYKEYSPLGFDAEGHVLIANSFVRQAPAMMRLLSLVSLEQIMSANQGIAFEEVKFPLEMQDRVLYIKKGRMKGPNIAMTLAGSVDFRNNKVNLDGSLTPASGLNSFIGRIPVLGAIITGTQDGLMVADFGVEGSTSKPEVWANPLSIVTPGLLKDIFGGIFGSKTPTPKTPSERFPDKEAPAEVNEEESYEDKIFSQ